MEQLDLYDKFSGYTVLPIKVDWLADQIKEDCKFAAINFISVDVNPKYLLGMHRVYVHDATNNKTLDVYYNDVLNHPDSYAMKRMVCAKELLHAYDGQQQTAKSREAVDKLVEGIVVPPSAGMGHSLASDHNGMLFALMVLLPRDALDKLIPAYEDGQLSVEDVAKIAAIPEPYVRLGLSRVWKDILETIC